MITWAFIFEAPETDPKLDRLVIERGGLRSIVVAVPSLEAIVDAAVDLVSEGAQFIELCGGCDPEYVRKVVEATGGRVPVGVVGYSGARTLQDIAAVFN
jgi:hypothetical protein